jgi:hypothetical protein
MTPLAAKLVFLTSSALGALTLGGTAYVVEHPPMVAPEPARALVIAPMVQRPLVPTPVVVPEPVEIEPLVITGHKAPIIAPVRYKPAPAKVKEFKPCTDWREMGPTNMKKGNESGVRRVRTLC